MHLAQWFCHCWWHFWNSCHGMAFNAVITFFRMSSISWNLGPFKADFIFGNSQKLFKSKSGDQSGYSISVTDFWVRNCSTESILWAGALSWWRIQLLGQTSGLCHCLSKFSCTVTALILKHVSKCITLHTFSTLSSVLWDCGWPLLSSSTFLQPSLNYSCHSKMFDFFIPSPQVSFGEHCTSFTCILS